MLRAGYKATVKFFSDSDELSEIVWYAVPTENGFLEHPTVFWSYVWDDQMEENTRDMSRGTLFQGEVMGTDRPWSNGALPSGYAFSGQACGTAEQWAGDLSLARDGEGALNGQGWPTCCPVPPEPIPPPLPAPIDNPSDIPGLIVWHRDWSFGASNGDLASPWIDRSGNANDAVWDFAAGMPVWDDTYAPLQAIRAFLGAASFPPAAVGLGKEYTIFLEHSYQGFDANTGQLGYIRGTATQNSPLVVSNAAGLFLTYQTGNGALSFLSVSLPYVNDGTRYGVVVRRSQQSVRMYRDGVLVLNGILPSNADGSYVSLFGPTITPAGSANDTYEVAIWPRALTDSELIQLDTYRDARYS